MTRSKHALLGALLAVTLITGCGAEPESPKSVLVTFNAHTDNILMDVIHNGSIIADNKPFRASTGGYSLRGSDIRFTVLDQAGNNLGTSNPIEVGENSIQGVVLAGHAGSTDVFAFSEPIKTELNGVFIHALKSLPKINLRAYDGGVAALTVPLSYKEQYGLAGGVYDSIVFYDESDRRLLSHLHHHCGNYVLILHDDTTSGKPPLITVMSLGPCPS
jgi:hypothetical protein